MTKREMISLLIKLMGIYALVLFVPTLVQSLGTLALTQLIHVGSETYLDSLLTIATTILLQLLWMGFCVCLICKSDSIAKRLYPDDSPAGQVTTLGFYDIQIVAFQLIGLVELLKGIRSTIEMLHSTYLFSENVFEEMLPGLGQLFPGLRWITVTRITIHFAVGVLLFLYPHIPANLWKRMQGQSKPIEENANS
jgi:hypothetical protein